MRFSARRNSLPSIIGGVENEYGIFFPGFYEPSAGGAPALQFCCMDFTTAIERMIAALGGSLYSVQGNMGGFWKEFLADGGALGFEEANVVEVATPECTDPVEAVAYLEKYEELFRRSINSIEHKPERLMMVKGPSYLPHFGPGRGPGFQLGFHLNFNARLSPGMSNELRAVMIALLPLMGCGGLTEKGFRISPLGRMAQKGHAPLNGRMPVLGMLQNGGTIVIDGRGEGEYHKEYRLHLPCFDRPLTKRMIVTLFNTYQLVVTLLLYGESLIRKVKPAHPSRTYAIVADSEYGRRFRLSGGGLATLYSLQEELCKNLERIRSSYRLSHTQEATVELLLGGLNAFAKDDKSYLYEHFDGYLKRNIYQRVLQSEGLSLDFFNRIAAPLVYRTCKVGIHLHELARLEGKETRDFLANAHKCQKHKDAVITLLKNSRLPAEDIPTFARVVQRILTLELALYRIFPGPSPLADHEERLWEDLTRTMCDDSTRRAPCRAQKRGELIRSIPEEARRFCVADWSGIYIFPSRESLGICSLPSPYSDEVKPIWAEAREIYELLEGTDLQEALCFDRYMLWPDRNGKSDTDTGKGLNDEEVRHLRDLGTQFDSRQLRLL